MLQLYCAVLASGFERQIGPNRLELKSFFQGQTETIPVTPLFDFPFTSYNKTFTSSIVISYRLFDVYACEKSPPINTASFEKYGFKDPPHIVSRSLMRLVEPHCYVQGFKQLYNWGNLVANASTILEGAVNHPLHLDDRPQTPSIRTYHHFAALCRTQINKQKIVAQCNFESAALHLSYLIEVSSVMRRINQDSHHFQGNVDLPDSPESFINAMQR